jgi:uncharacterized protein (TIGR02147 family)
MQTPHFLKLDFPWELTSSLQILQTLVRARESLGKGFSYRSLAAKCGFSTPNYVQLLVGGKKALTSANIIKLSSALRLSEDEQKYWNLAFIYEENLKVLSPSADAVFSEMNALRGKNLVLALNSSQDGLFENWYTPIVWAFSKFLLKKSEQANLAKILNLSIEQIEIALSKLVQEGFLNENFEHPKNEILEMKTMVSQNRLTNYFAENFQQMSLQMKSRSFARVSTISMEAEKISELKSKVRNFQIQLLEEFNTEIKHLENFVVVQLAVGGFTFSLSDQPNEVLEPSKP